MSAILSLNYSALTASLAQIFLSSTYSSTSASIQSVYSSVNTLSANWQSSYNSVSSLSSNWQSGFNTTSALSAGWQNSFTSVTANSAYWQTCYTTLTTSSARWNTFESWGYFPAAFTVGNVYPLNEGGFRTGTLSYMNLRLSAGYGTVALNKNGVSTGTYTISTTRIAYTPNVAYVNGDSFSLTLCSVSAAANLSYSLGLTLP